MSENLEVTTDNQLASTSFCYSCHTSGAHRQDCELNKTAAEESGGAFEPIDSYERLIKLREESPDAFMLRTSEATRRTLFHYERQREMSGAKPKKT